MKLVQIIERCKRSSGTERAWFLTREQAEAFARDPANWPTYRGDIPALCTRCNLYHLNRPEWLEPIITHQDAELLESMGIGAPARMDEYFRCKVCGTLMREGIDFS